MTKDFVKNIAAIQSELKAPKGQYNSFGKYKYRSAEDILESVKPLVNKYGYILLIDDDIFMVGSRVYVKATATITDGEETISNTAFARESETKVGMDAAQITGAASSYARKYALNGLFCIDDTKDMDALNTSKEFTQPAKPPYLEDALANIKAATTKEDLARIYNDLTALHTNKDFMNALSARKKEVLK